MTPPLTNRSTKRLAALRVRTHRYSTRRLRRLGVQLYGPKPPRRRNSESNSLPLEAQAEAHRALVSASRNHGAAVTTARLLRGGACPLPADVYEDDVSLSDSDRPSRVAVRPSYLSEAHTRAPPYLVPFETAVRSVADDDSLSAGTVSSIAVALRAYAMLFRTHKPDAKLRDVLAETYVPGWFGTHALSVAGLPSDSGPVRAAVPLSRDTLRMAMHRTAGLLRIFGADETLPFRSRTADAISEIGNACPNGWSPPSKQILNIMAQCYGGCAGLAEDEAQLADFVPYIGEGFRRAFVQSLRQIQIDVLVGKMHRPCEALAKQLIMAGKSARSVLRVTPDILGDMLRVEYAELHRVCIAIFGEHPEIFEQVNGYVSHPYAAAAAVQEQIGGLAVAATAPLSSFLALAYPAGCEEDCLRLFVVLHEGTIAHENWICVSALLSELESLDGVENAKEVGSRLLEGFGNLVERLQTAACSEVQAIVPMLSTRDVAAVQGAMRLASSRACASTRQRG